MTDAKHYTGGCHCGRVRYEVTADLGQTTQCNCSICTARGLIVAFVPAAQFKLVSGDGLTDYQFNKKHIHHLFCPVCGIESFAKGKSKKGEEMVAINARCLDGVEVEALKPAPFDGRKL